MFLFLCLCIDRLTLRATFKRLMGKCYMYCYRATLAMWGPPTQQTPVANNWGLMCQSPVMKVVKDACQTCSLWMWPFWRYHPPSHEMEWHLYFRVLPSKTFWGNKELLALTTLPPPLTTPFDHFACMVFSEARWSLDQNSCPWTLLLVWHRSQLKLTWGCGLMQTYCPSQ